MEMICENAGKCLESNCPEKKRHETDGRCVKECFICGGIKGSKCIPYVESANNGCYQSTESWTHCPHLDAQQIVELPKDPLEELINEYDEHMLTLKDNTTTHGMLREFAAKVRAL